MTKEAFNYFERMINCGMNVLRKKDIELGAMDEHYEPVNHLLSADKNLKFVKY